MYDISIIMGIYNCENTLDEAIQSILNQTYSNWKLILCDDGSKDSSYNIAKKYADNYENIILIANKKNMGLNFTLNHCLEYVDTEFVARMDGDDICLPTRLEKEINFLRNNPIYSIVSTNMDYFDENGIWGKSRMITTPTNKDLVKGTPFCHAPCMVRAEAIKKVGGYSVEKLLLRVEDYHLWYKMYLEGYKGYNLDECLYQMRDDRNATHRRRYKFRINEAYVKLLVIRDLKLSFLNYVYVLKPLLVGLLPTSLYTFVHKKTIKNLNKI